jgi:hypothetical protein
VRSQVKQDRRSHPTTPCGGSTERRTRGRLTYMLDACLLNASSVTVLLQFLFLGLNTRAETLHQGYIPTIETIYDLTAQCAPPRTLQ